jgi:hypothetical protein
MQLRHGKLRIQLGEVKIETSIFYDIVKAPLDNYQAASKLAWDCYQSLV